MAALYALFLASGATSLTWQLLWERQLHLVFGTSTFAIAAVLATFMGGLGLGGLVGARLADRVARPLRAYAVLEAIIGLYAAGFPTLLRLLEPVYLALDATLPVVALALLVPTAAMGATLPLLARVATRAMTESGHQIGALYAVNTAGAVVGTVVAAFWLLPSLGLWWTTVLTAGGNLAIALIAWGLDRGTPEIRGRAEAGVSAPLLMVVMAAAGFASMVYEVTWTRVLALVSGPTVHGFAVMLIAFLAGIALGGRVGGPLADGVRRRHGVVGGLLSLAIVELLVGASSWGLARTYAELPYLYVELFDGLGVVEHPRASYAVTLVLAGAVMTPPAVLMGMAWPLAVRAAIADPGAIGRPVGLVTGANTLGGALGAVLAGFVLLPRLQVTGTLAVAIQVNALAAAGLAVAAAVRDRRALAVVALAGGLALLAPRVPWQPRVMTSGVYHYVSHFDDHSREGIDRFGVDTYDLLFYEEGPTSVVTVGRDHATGALWLANSGKVEATSEWDLPTQILCGVLPLQFVSDPQDVLLIGLASGITGGAMATDPRIERFDIVEIEPATIRAAALFAPWNHDVLSDPRVRLSVNDGRNHVLRAPPGSWDLIVSEPSNPWISGVANLFTLEFFELGKRRLKPGGVWAQWLHAYGMGEQELRSLLATFAEVYPHVVVYDALNVSDLVLIGSDRPLVADEAHAAALLASPSVAEELGRIGITTELGVVSRFLLDRSGVLAVAAGAGLNTDDNLRVEYAAPHFVHRNTTVRNRALVLEHAQVPPVQDGSLRRALLEHYRTSGDPRGIP